MKLLGSLLIAVGTGIIVGITACAEIHAWNWTGWFVVGPVSTIGLLVYMIGFNTFCKN